MALKAPTLLTLSLFLTVPTAQVISAEYVLSPDERDPAGTSGDFKSVQAALNRTNAGDIVTLMPGSYLVNLQFPRKAITLRGDPASVPGDVVLDGAGCDPGTSLGWCTTVTFYWEEEGGEIEDGTVPHLENMTLTGGWPVMDDYDTEFIHGGGLWLDEANPTLSDLIITDNTSGDKGGGIYLEKAAPTLENVTISDNVADASGAGFYMILGTPTLNNVTIRDNYSEWKGGGLFLGRSAPIFNQVRIENNRADADGGGIYMNASAPYFEGVAFLNNDAGVDGGALFLEESAPVLSQVVVASNTAARAGGGLFLEDSDPILHNTILAYNTAQSGKNIQCYDPIGGCDLLLDHTLAWTGNGDDSGFENVSPSATTFIVKPYFVDIDEGNLHLSHPDSPAIDAGSAFCFNPETTAFDLPCSDPDGSVSDIGLFGGPKAGGDLDGDGAQAQAWWPEDNAGQAHVQNDDDTQLDCDDNNADTYPGAPELPDDLDNDCDGTIDEESNNDSKGPGCGCSSSQAQTPTLGLIFILGMLGLRRRPM